MDLTPQSINPESVRSVTFREKLRGYHPDDVDAFVAAVAQALDDLEGRARLAESALAELQSRSSAAVEAEDSLRRTLVLAQRTADLAIQEAREEAARIVEEPRAQRAAVAAELAELRTRLHAEVEEESRDERSRFVAERAALLTDIEALDSHLERERERLRIYFTDQLRRVDEGEPGMAPSPAMEAEVVPDPVVDPAADTDVGPGLDVDAAETGGAGDFDVEGDFVGSQVEEDDPFLAELRRAVTDDQPLGPRDHVATVDPGEESDDGFDLFARGDDEAGRFGSRLRRRK